MTSTNEITMYRGNDRMVRITVLRKSTGAAYNLTGCTITMMVKKSINDADANAIISKSTTDNTEGVIIDAAGGVVEFYLVPADTDDVIDILKDNVPYSTDFEVTTPNPNSKKYTVLRTWLTILAK